MGRNCFFPSILSPPVYFHLLRSFGQCVKQILNNNIRALSVYVLRVDKMWDFLKGSSIVILVSGSMEWLVQPNGYYSGPSWWSSAWAQSSANEKNRRPSKNSCPFEARSKVVSLAVQYRWSNHPKTMMSIFDDDEQSLVSPAINPLSSLIALLFFLCVGPCQNRRDSVHSSKKILGGTFLSKSSRDSDHPCVKLFVVYMKDSSPHFPSVSHVPLSCSCLFLSLSFPWPYFSLGTITDDLIATYPRDMILPWKIIKSCDRSYIRIRIPGRHCVTDFFCSNIHWRLELGSFY